MDAVIGDVYGNLRYFVNEGSTSDPVFIEATGTDNPFSGIDVAEYSSPELMDLDADGDLDGVVGGSRGGLRYFENMGSTTGPVFVEPTGTDNPFAGIEVFLHGDPELVDLDRDGDFDAVVGEFYGSLRFFENTGSTSGPELVEAMGAANPFFGIDIGSTSSPALVDLDGDGDLDAVVGESLGSLRYFENTGSTSDPAFVEATGTDNPFAGIDAGFGSSPELVDLDGDGDLDAVVGENSGSLRHFENTGSTSGPVFVEATGTDNPFDGIDVGQLSSPNLVDLDGDGDFDAVVGGQFGTLRYFENTGTSSGPVFAEATGTENPFADIDVGYDSKQDLVDLDGDSDLDALVGENGGRVVFFRSLFADIFADGFESGTTDAWSATLP